MNIHYLLIGLALLFVVVAALVKPFSFWPVLVSVLLISIELFSRVSKVMVALLALSLFALAAPVHAQSVPVTVTNPIPNNPLNTPLTLTNAPSFWGGLGETGEAILNWFKANPNAAAATNTWFVIPYGVYHSGDWGAGVRGYYQVSTYVWTGLGLEWWETKAAGNTFYAPSASVQFQTPQKIGPVEYMPFTCAGVITPLGGTGTDNKSVQGFVGAGLALKVYKAIYLAGDVETWSVGGVSYRGGVGGSF